MPKPLAYQIIYMACQVQKGRRSAEENETEFLNTVKKGDILICKRGLVARLIGHAAIMATDHWVLEMPGVGPNGNSEDNNRRISKHSWFKLHNDITVYRCRNKRVAKNAANWAYTHYYNPVLGADEKTIHVRYLINTDFKSTDTSYCSKLVTQAYYYGVSSNVLSYVHFNLSVLFLGNIIIPTQIPGFFTRTYLLELVGVY